MASKKKNINNNKRKIALLHQQKLELANLIKPTNVTINNSFQTNKVLENDKDFKKIFNKFKLSKNNEHPHNTNNNNQLNINTTQSIDNSSPTKIIEKVQKGTATHQLNNTQRLSKKKLKLLKKPTLSELKSMVKYSHPESIQWYDTDAQYPQVNAYIKTSKNVVQVPVNWQFKRDYLTSRSLMEKPPFELPDIILETGIHELRNTSIMDTETNPQEQQSLKDINRNRVQPKLGTLDLDYKKLHDVILTMGENWKPDYLLSFGDLYYENRNLAEEQAWRKAIRKIRPGKLNSSLREALNCSSARLPVWCNNNKDEHIAGKSTFNNHYQMELSNGIDKDGVYANIIRRKKRKISKKNNTVVENELFGAKVLVKRTNIEINNEKEYDNEREIGKEENIEYKDNDKNGIVVGTTNKDDTAETLYTILDQKSGEESRLIYYDMSGISKNDTFKQ
ncbi:uncharacterized protein SCODWIG_01594 [Saccharomycodes ludwigii]|uniref:DUF382 domain-containing protein n=1 Tax=Saccharomycodes ludwigii TaxID=36035 RepID=A0A376B596_9ASCO|nr:hypothetical protein SCDLUD_000796 [Saccharomycodes ludwigii]KAH3903180.1 hypothetical protein SCDLUD_000796 [Saccharomycodes ludwigii]SSD59833.1 uncharacterized protein SCODWIG_01594 [Saccharomycodes ludwigii]